MEKGLALLLVLALAACNGTKPQAKVRLAVGGAAQLVYLPTTLAQQLGYFAAEGLEVEFQDYPGGSKALQSLLGGSADVVSGFYDHTIQMAAEGKALQAFIVLVQHPGLVLVVSPAASKRIGSMADLAGAKVGVTAPGSSTHFFLNFLLSKHGMNPDAVSVIGIGHSASAVAAMESGQVDAAVMTDPAVSQITRRTGPVRILADTRTPNGVQAEFDTAEVPAAVLYAKREWIQANENTVRRLTRAMRRTLTWIQEHDAKAISAKMPASHRGTDTALYEAALTASIPIYATGGPMPEAGARAVERVLRISLPKLQGASIDLPATYTDRFLKE
jgi:NitT/TauT family transport system substrate-binding protein